MLVIWYTALIAISGTLISMARKVAVTAVIALAVITVVADLFKSYLNNSLSGNKSFLFKMLIMDKSNSICKFN